jgi:hypothetical protein
MTIPELLNAITAELTAIGAATDLDLIEHDGDRASAFLTIEGRVVRLSLEPAEGNIEDWLVEDPYADCQVLGKESPVAS